MLTDRVIEEGTLLVDEDSLSFDIRIPWYRSFPLSCVEGIEVRVDSTSVPAADTWIAFGDTTYGLGDLAPLYDEWWTVTDPARVRVQARAGSGRGRSRSTSRSASGSPTSWSVTGGS